MFEKRKKAILVAPLNSSFVKTDILILSNDFDVKPFIIGNHKGFSYLFRILSLFYFILKNIKDTKLFYSWFADYHSLFPTIFSKFFNIKSIVCVGGYDATYLEKYNYGILNNSFRGKISKLVVKLSDQVFFSSFFLQNSYLKNNINHLESKFHVIYPAFDEPKNLTFSNNKKVQFVCVSYCNNINRAHIKGIDRFLSMAKMFNQFSFILIGISKNFEKDDIFRDLPNLKIYNELEKNEIYKILNESLFICQLSRFEAFGLAVLEGIYFKCIPIITNGTGLVEIIQNLSSFVCIKQEEIIKSYFDPISFMIDHPNQHKIDQPFLSNQFSLESRAKKIHFFVCEAINS